MLAGTQLIDAYNVAKELQLMFGQKKGETPNISSVTGKSLRALNIVVDKSLCARDARGDIVEGNFAIGDSAERAATLLLRSGFSAVNHYDWRGNVYWEPTVEASDAARSMAEAAASGSAEDGEKSATP